jgi:hypothetical protein
MALCRDECGADRRQAEDFQPLSTSLEELVEEHTDSKVDV